MLEPQVTSCVRKTQASYFPLSSPRLCLFKAPTATVGLCAQDSRQALASTGDQARHLVQGPREP